MIFGFQLLVSSLLTMPIIIDGYNLLRAIEKTESFSPVLTDAWLCRMITAYLRQIDEAGCVVFDGIGPPDKEIFEDMGNLEVIFSGRNKDADKVIEDKITANTAPKRLLVVSSDRRLRVAARKRRAISVKAEVFWESVISEPDRKPRPREPREKREGITESETEQWLKSFGLDED
jgi:predicted RNA-binding protein with PIN domain